VYRLAEMPGLSHPDLVTVALRVPRAVVCLVSALACHDATDEVPHEVQIALPRRTKAPRIEHPPLRVFWFSGPALSEGVQVVNVDGVDVRIYDLPKTVVDCFRFRNKLGLDVAVDGLNQAIRSKGVRPADRRAEVREAMPHRERHPALRRGDPVSPGSQGPSPASRDERERYAQLLARLTPSPSVYEQYRLRVDDYVSLLRPLLRGARPEGLVALRLRRSELFEGREYLVAYVEDDWLRGIAPNCDAIAPPMAGPPGVAGPWVQIPPWLPKKVGWTSRNQGKEKSNFFFDGVEN